MCLSATCLVPNPRQTDMTEDLRKHYEAQAKLLMEVQPYVAAEKAFALKGGTAINMYYRELPRLSVDIDIAYLPVHDRAESLRAIDAAFSRIVTAIRSKKDRKYRVFPASSSRIRRFRVARRDKEVKVELSPVMRGTVYPSSQMELTDAAEARYGYKPMCVASFEDVYAGKMAAALERQHPRDLYDIHFLYRNEGVTEDLFRVYMVYLASSGKPIHEALAPVAQFKDDLYNAQFLGMALESVSKEELLEARARLHADVRGRLTGDIAQFLLSLHDAEPDFDLIGLPDAANLPGVRWKILNLEKLKRENPDKHADQRTDIERLLG